MVRRTAHVARQPISDRTGKIVAYELLYRGDAHSQSSGIGQDGGAAATGRVIITAFAEFGLSGLVGQLVAFLNMTPEFLTGALPVPFGSDRVVLEILESTEVTPEVDEGVRSLVARGYAIALDDFVVGGGQEQLLPLASYVKLEVCGTPPDVLAAAVGRVRAYPGLRLVAERLESQADVDRALGLGFDLFQGYLLGRPQNLATEALDPSRMRQLQLLALVSRPDVEMAELAGEVITDPALSMRVLRACNAAASGRVRRVASIQEATVILGLERLRQWIALMTASDLAGGDTELLTSIMTRAKLCQLVAASSRLSGDVGFTVGLVSGVADRMAVDPGELLARLPLTTELAEAVIAGRGPFGRLLELVRAYEKGAVDADDDAADGVADERAAGLWRTYLEAVSWSNQTVEQLA
jgi:EAL and modified HD-GYP domain-containing signal transduction protein